MNKVFSEEIIAQYKSSPYALLSLVLEKEASFPYSLVLSSGVCVSKVITFKANQLIKAVNYYEPELEVSQSYSESSFLRSASRYYDSMEGEILCFETEKKEQFATLSPKSLTYDQYLGRYGKLFSRKYYSIRGVTEKGDIVKDTFLSRDGKDYKKASSMRKQVVYGTLIYDINEAIILSSKLKEEGDGFSLFLSLDPRYADVYYALQMMSQGSLYDYPKFQKSELTARISKDLVLESLLQHDVYSAKTGFITADIDMTMEKRFYHSDRNSFLIDGARKKVIVPRYQDPDFLFEEEKD